MAKVCFSTLQGMREEVSFPMFLKKMTPSRRNVSSHYEEEEAPVEFASKVEEYYLHFFIKQLK